MSGELSHKQFSECTSTMWHHSKHHLLFCPVHFQVHDPQQLVGLQGRVCVDTQVGISAHVHTTDHWRRKMRQKIFSKKQETASANHWRQTSRHFGLIFVCKLRKSLQWRHRLLLCVICLLLCIRVHVCLTLPGVSWWTSQWHTAFL